MSILKKRSTAGQCVGIMRKIITKIFFKWKRIIKRF